MVFPMALFKIATHWLFSFYRAARKIRSYGFLHRSPSRPLQTTTSLIPSVAKCSLEGRESQTLLVCDLQNTLLRSSSSASIFPYFMLVAFEGGSLLRALVLLLSSPFLWALGYDSELGMRIMIFISFCGLRTKDVELVGRIALHKFYLENLHLHAYELLASTYRRVVFTTIPRVMVEGFLRDYLSVSQVIATELQMVKGCYFTGLLKSSPNQKALGDLFAETKPDVCLVRSSNLLDHVFNSHCKEAYIVNTSAVLPREKYPKPLVFHDGRLAFFPTPLASLSSFLWLPLAIPLSIIRIILGILPPYKAIIILGALTGVRFRVKGLTNTVDTSKTNKKGVLYVCTHRTLLDPVMLTTALQRALPAVTYSLSLMSEALAPMKTVRLTRDRDCDAETMRRLLDEGDLAVCPEGTTCREPYLLRFSPLFAELAEQIVPVAMDARGGMFYGTTASGLKSLDPLFFLMNPTPRYTVEFLERVPRERTCAGGCTASDVANGIQRQLADALGFECTGLTRRDKYLMLAGNEGVVKQERERKKGR